MPDNHIDNPNKLDQPPISDLKEIIAKQIAFTRLFDFYHGSGNLFREIGLELLFNEHLNEMKRRYLALALIDLSDGKPFREAFKVKSLGRPFDEATHIRNLKIAVDIYEAMQFGMSLEKAAVKIGEVYNVSEYTAQKTYKKFCHRFKGMSDMSLVHDYIERLEARIR